MMNNLRVSEMSEITEKTDTHFSSDITKETNMLREYINESGNKADAEIIQLPVLLDDGTLLLIEDTSGKDDSGNSYLSENGGLLPDNTFEKNGIVYRTDDKGFIFCLDGAVVGDDNGKTYLDENGNYLPNNTFVLEGVSCKTDDNGVIYSKDGKLLPNMTYELDGYVYTTDENGRIIKCEAKPERTPEKERNNEEQKQAGGESRKENDQGGHIIGRDIGGDGGNGNLIPMDANINQSDYKKMENDIKKALDNGSDVTVSVEMSYSEDSERPDKITVTVTVDGKETVYIFDNNLDGSLIHKVTESGKDTVQTMLDATGGTISSIKTEYDENGEPTKVTVMITYTDENGNTKRVPVIIDDPSGGKNESD